MATIAQIGNVADLFVDYWLRDHGYSTNIDSRSPDATDLEARGPTRSLLVRVRSAVQPDTPDSLSSDEVHDLVSRAAQLGMEPWEARVQLDQQLQQVGQVQWRKLA